MKLLIAVVVFLTLAGFGAHALASFPPEKEAARDLEVLAEDCIDNGTVKICVGKCYIRVVAGVVEEGDLNARQELCEDLDDCDDRRKMAMVAPGLPVPWPCTGQPRPKWCNVVSSPSPPSETLGTLGRQMPPKCEDEDRWPRPKPIPCIPS